MVIDLRWIAFLPFVAVGVAVLAILVRVGLRGSVGYGTSVYWYRTSYYGRGNPIWGVVVGVIGLGMCGFLSLNAGNQLREFRNDPGCAAGFSGEAGASSLCRVVPATIRGHEVYHHRHSTDYDLDLALDDGSMHRVTLSGFSRSFWDDIRAGDTLATVQVYRGKIVAVQTDAGMSKTDIHPAVMMSAFSLAGIVCGVIGVVFALMVAFRGNSRYTPGLVAGPPGTYPPGPFT